VNLLSGLAYNPRILGVLAGVVDVAHGRYVANRPVKEIARAPREKISQTLGGVLGAALLCEREDAVHHDNDEDRST